MNINMNNYGIVRGRLTEDPRFYTNKDGSKKVTIRVAVQNNYVSKSSGERESQFLPFEAMIAKDAADDGVYARIHKGDKIGVQFELKNNNWTDKNGEKHFDIVMAIRQISLEESKTVTDNRLAQRAATAPSPEDAAANSVPDEA